MMRMRISTILPVLLALALLAALQMPAVAQEPDKTIYLPLTMGGGGTPTPPPPPNTPSIFGIAAEADSSDDDYQKIAAAGAGWARPGLSVNWAVVEPEIGQRNWSALADFEAQLQFAAANGQTPMVVIENTPDWALVDPGSGRCGPISDLPAFGSFLTDLVQRYSVTPYHVQHWELWNTPDALTCWGESDSGSGYGSLFYGAMLQTAYPAIKAADPQATVLVGALEMRCNQDTELCNAQLGFTRNVVFGANAFFDGVAFQAYDGLMIADEDWGTTHQYANSLWSSSWDTTGPVVLAKADFLTALFDPEAPKLLFAHIADQCACQGDYPEFEQSKAGYLVQAYTAAQSRGVQAVIWRSLRGDYLTGLVKADGSDQPAYRAAQFANQMLAGATYVGPIEGDMIIQGARGHIFTDKDGREILVVWYASDNSYAVSIEFAGSSAGWNMYGEPLALADGMVEINPDNPVYIQFP